jgi:hypothetical protein
MNRRLIRYMPPGASDRGESSGTRSAFQPSEDARMDYGGAPDIPGLRALFQRRRIEQIRERMLQRHREMFGADE